MHARVPPWRMLRRFCSYLMDLVIVFLSFKKGIHTYGVFFLDIELEVNRAGAGGCYAELCGGLVGVDCGGEGDGMGDGAYAIE
jgi:hypothetical protein